jgi:hypothetical protein
MTLSELLELTFHFFFFAVIWVRIFY